LHAKGWPGNILFPEKAGKLYPMWIPGNIFKCYGFRIILKEGFECTETSAQRTDNCALL